MTLPGPVRGRKGESYGFTVNQGQAQGASSQKVRWMNPQPWWAPSALVWAQHPEGQYDLPPLQQSAFNSKPLVWHLIEHLPCAGTELGSEDTRLRKTAPTLPGRAGLKDNDIPVPKQLQRREKPGKLRWPPAGDL